MQKPKKVHYVQEDVIMDHDMIAKCRFRVDSDGEYLSCEVERTLMRVHPYTDDLRAQAARERGRGGFSYGKSVCILPSAHFYRPQEVVEELARAKGEYYNDRFKLEEERDEED